MKILITKIVFLICTIIISLTVLVLLAPKDELSYYSVMNNKVKRLEQLPSPKFILVGGSNLTFGIDSKSIESKFNLPVVNMSLHAGFGLDFMLGQIINRVKKGDIVLISPEYDLFRKHFSKGVGMNIYEFIVNENKYIYEFSLYNLLFNIDALGPALFKQYKQLFEKRAHGLYSRVNFNEYGDMIGHLRLEHEPFDHDVGNNSYVCDIDNSKIEIISDFVNYMKNTGVNTYISFPVISYTEYNNNKECNDKIANIINSKFKQITISSKDMYIFNDNLFFNTDYHVDNIGRKMRTEYLINDLNNIPIKN